jgi:hypothetical protein
MGIGIAERPPFRNMNHRLVMGYLSRATTKYCRSACALLVLAAGPACGGSDPSAGEASPVARSSEALLGICAPLTCCFPTGGGWESNPFEDGLRSLGCTEPHAYTQSYGRSEWWMYSRCPLSAKLTDLVARYALVDPYYSQFAVNACLELDAVGNGQLTSAFVQWDPICGSCTYPASQ